MLFARIALCLCLCLILLDTAHITIMKGHVLAGSAFAILAALAAIYGVVSIPLPWREK